MSIDTYGRTAAREVLAATSDVDVESALRQVVDVPQRRRAVGPSLAILAVVVAVILGFVLVAELNSPEEPPRPLDAPPSLRVGESLRVPVTLAVPGGWEVTRDQSYVELTPADGSGGRILALSPRAVYDPPSYEARPLNDDLVLWAVTHPHLIEAERNGVDGPGFAWAGTSMKLTLSAGGRTPREIPLIRLPGTDPPEALTISFDERTYLWTVVYLEGNAPLLVVGISSSRDDPEVKAAVDSVLESIEIENSSPSKEKS